MLISVKASSAIFVVGSIGELKNKRARNLCERKSYKVSLIQPDNRMNVYTKFHNNSLSRTKEQRVEMMEPVQRTLSARTANE